MACVLFHIISYLKLLIILPFSSISMRRLILRYLTGYHMVVTVFKDIVNTENIPSFRTTSYL